MSARSRKHPAWRNTFIASAGVGLLILIAFVGSLLQIKVTTTPTLTGISIFAVFYIAAQLSERLTEVISDTVAGESANEVSRDKEEIEVTKARINSHLEKNPLANVDELVNHIETLETRSRYEGNMRAVALWVVASAIGVAFTSVTIGFFELIGLTWMPHVADSFVSGIIIGGGSKPLHDFISYIQQQKG